MKLDKIISNKKFYTSTQINDNSFKIEEIKIMYIDFSVLVAGCQFPDRSEVEIELQHIYDNKEEIEQEIKLINNHLNKKV